MNAFLDRVTALIRIGPVGLVRLAGWKAGLAARSARDRKGGYARRLRTDEAWAEAWLRRWGGQGVGAWLRRPGAGRLWVEPGDAAAWCRFSCTETDMEIARSAVGGEFDLIGSGPVSLGTPPDWRRDLYTGAEWPLENSARYPLVRGDGSDIRTVWELSRAYHLVALARAFHRTGDPAFRDTFIEHVASWLDQNPLGRGPHWASPMDAAIRAANWSLACVLFADVEGIEPAFWARLLTNLRTTAWFVARHQEWHPVHRGNHYVANMVGLVYVGALCADDREGRGWLHLGARVLEREIRYQVHDDGVSFEASLAYHRLVTELFAYGAEVIRRNVPDHWTERYQARLRGMYRFIATYLPPGGEAPMLGDADDGRLHAVSAEGFVHPRRHALGLPDEWWPRGDPGSAAFPDGGFYVIRHGDDHCVIRCGPLGLAGAGSHDHNDQLSFELVAGGRRVIRDSGTYCYTRDLQARHRFRSTTAHSVVQIDGLEQNPIAVDRPWRVLADRTRARATQWSAGADEVVFHGEHHGFGPGVRVERRITYWPATRVWRIEDRVVSDGVGAPPGGAVARFILGEPGDVVVSDVTPAAPPMAPTVNAAVIRWPDSPAVSILADAPCSDRYGHVGQCRVALVRFDPASSAGLVTVVIPPAAR